MSTKVSRRTFMISGVSGSLFLGTKANAVGKQVVDLLNPNSPIMMPPNFSPSVWFTMESNGRTTIHVLKAEMGQHVGTAFAQIVAEQLGLNWNTVDIDYPEMDFMSIPKYGFQITGGSYSVHEMYDSLSRTAAVARRLLLETGADLMGSEIEDCKVLNSKVIDELFEQEISFSEILSETSIDYEILEEDLGQAELIPRTDYKIIGKSIPAIDIPEKINGSARFGIDAYVPNMLYAKIIVPPTRLGSSIISINDAEAKKIDGYVTTLPVNFPPEALAYGFVTHSPIVIAKNYPSALRASKMIKVKWSESETKHVSSDILRSDAIELLNDKSKAVDFFKIGDLDQLKNTDFKTIEANYETSMVAHLPLEPANAMARYVDDVLHIYSSHQGGTLLPTIISSYTGISPEKIIFHPHLIGGGFGKKFEFEAIVLASIAAIQLREPIKLIFTREDDMAFAHPRTSTYQKMTAYLDPKILDSRSLQGTKHEIVGGWVDYGDEMMFVNPIIDGVPVDGKNKVPMYSVTGSDHWYDVPNVDVVAYRQTLIEKTIPVRAVRSVANNYTIFAVESFIDEISHELKMDSLALRLELLKGKGINSGEDAEKLFEGAKKPFWQLSGYHESSSYQGGKRLANVLRIAAGLANYGTKKLKHNTAQGIAIAGAEERSNPSFAACIAEVAVDSNSAKIKVKKITVAIDLGLIVNPDSARAQIEGSILWGLSACLYEKMTIKNGAVVERNFDAYKWQNVMDLPEIDIHIMENGLHPTGAGEPATAIISPAIANAVFNAVGVRMRKLPIDRAELLSQL